MAQSFDVWQDKIILRWDKEVPPEIQERYEKFRPEKKERVSLIEYCREEALAEHWQHVGPFMKWNQKIHGFLMSFSQQNLKRIYHQFGLIEHSKKARERIAVLKAEFAEFQRMVENVGYIKSTPELENLYFKLPPLAEYQHRGVIFLTETRSAPLFADCGCLTGDTVIRYNRAGKSYSLTIEEMYKNQERNRSNRRADIKTQIRAFKGDVIGLHPIVRVVQQGIKGVMRLKLEDGKVLKATPDHEILTSAGWVELEKLNAGDQVMIDNLVKHQAKAVKTRAKKLGDKRIAVGRYHPYARYQSSHGGKSGSYLLELHRSIKEADLSGMELEDFIERTYTGETGPCRFVDPKQYHIHHKDGDHYNNNIANLEILPAHEHFKHHTKGYKNFAHGEPEYSKVVSVEPAGEEMTYDIICEDPHRNFVANGVVVHNCGKTYMVLVSTENQLRQGLIEPGKTLILAKLNTIETGWLKDTEKFTNLKAQSLWLPQTSNRKQKLIDMLNEPADIYIINHEGLFTLKDELIAKGFQKVVVDESTILKSFRSERQRTGGKFGQGLLEISHNASWRVAMSGTPVPNGGDDAWGQIKFLDPKGFLLEPSFYDFQKAYMREVVFGSRDSGAPSKWVMSKEGNDQVKTLLSHLAFQVKIRDHLKDLPELTVIKRSVPMDSEQMKHYLQMKEELSTTINDEFISTDLRLTQMMKLRQITGGFIVDQQEKAHEMKVNPKMEALDDLLNDEIDVEEKVIIYAQYRWEVRQIASRYKKHGTVTVYGENSSKTNLDNIKRFIDDPKTRIIVLHPKSAAHGITFTHAHYMVFYSISHSAEDDYQCRKRIERAGQKNAMFVYYLLAKDSSKKPKPTIDESIYNCIQVKLENQSELIDQGTADTNLLRKWKEMV